MKIINEYPPNIETIKLVLNPPKNAVFAYSPNIYNPSKKELLPDIIEHEKKHIERQGDNPEAWYAQYLINKEFRLDEELIAYSTQLKYAKMKGIKGKMFEWLIDNMSKALSSDYGLDISWNEAKSKIRNYE